MTDFQQAVLDLLERMVTALEAYALQPQAPETDIPPLTDGECLQRLEDTGYITRNPRITDRTAYLVKKAHNVLEVFDEIAKMTGSGLRARAIMFQNMGSVKSTLDRHRPKRTLKGF